MFSLIGSVLGAVGSAFGLKRERDQRLSAQATADAYRDQDYGRQKEFAQNAIQWRVADAKAAGLHPLFALGGSGAAYSPASTPVFTGSGQGWGQMGQSLGRVGQEVANFYERRSKSAAQLDGPPWDGQPPVAEPYSVSVPSNLDPGYPLAPIDYGVQPPYGMVSHTAKPTSQLWDIPQVGRVILPEASNFSEALESLDSITGQAIYLMINRQTLGVYAEKAVYDLMKSIHKNVPALGQLQRIGDSVGRYLTGRIGEVPTRK